MTIQMNPRLLYIPVLYIDTNLINARQKLPTVNQLEKWFKDEVILINLPSTAYGEALAGNNAMRTRKANQQIYTLTTSYDPLYSKVESALFPEGAHNDNQRNDVKIVCDAAKNVAILVTGDGGSKTQPGGILGNRDKLRNVVRILSPDEAVAFVREKIRERDEFNKQIAEQFGYELPPWTGLD
ncbi:MAG: hypothetical protein NTY36_04385 [Deltaproteobacteria bacterium]|nr:hypothetical protein [Deltaproteobacteria bacterium]